MDYKNKMEIMTNYMVKINLLYADLAKLYDITYSEMLIYTSLFRESFCTQKKISSDWQIPKQTVNKTIKEMERQGFIEFREGRNKKEKLIVITSKGKKKIIPIIDEISDVEIRILKKMGEPQLKHMILGIQKFSDLFEEELMYLKR